MYDKSLIVEKNIKSYPVAGVVPMVQGTMVEKLCLNGFTLYKYICD